MQQIKQEDLATRTWLEISFSCSSYSMIGSK